MAPDGIVEAIDVTTNCRLGLSSGQEHLRQTNSDFKVLKKVSTTELS
jgi:hypothetical protein